ncbi:hypothetical protein [Methylobacterium sp. CM6247]
MMTSAASILAAILVAVAAKAQAQDAETVRLRNAINDQTRAQERQAETLRQLEVLQRDQARRADSARQNAERDSRSMRRFDQR